MAAGPVNFVSVGFESRTLAALAAHATHFHFAPRLSYGLVGAERADGVLPC